METNRIEEVLRDPSLEEPTLAYHEVRLPWQSLCVRPEVAARVLAAVQGIHRTDWVRVETVTGSVVFVRTEHVVFVREWTPAQRASERKFWDALDAISVQAYFPLVEHEGPPTDAELRSGWDRIVARLEAYGASHGRPVVLGELGYNRSLEAAVRPWEYAVHADPEAESLQVRCLDTALAAVDRSAGIKGAFLWKWFPGEVARGNFRKSTPAMRQVIARHWATVGG